MTNNNLTRNQLIERASQQMAYLSIGDIERVNNFVAAIIEQKKGKREQRQKSIRKFNEGLGSK